MIGYNICYHYQLATSVRIAYSRWEIGKCHQTGWREEVFRDTCDDCDESEVAYQKLARRGPCRSHPAFDRAERANMDAGSTATGMARQVTGRWIGQAGRGQSGCHHTVVYLRVGWEIGSQEQRWNG